MAVLPPTNSRTKPPTKSRAAHNAYLKARYFRDQSTEEGFYRVVLERQYSVGGSAGPSYDIAAVGQRFLMIKADDSAQPPKLVLVQNWFEELKARVPTGQ